MQPASRGTLSTPSVFEPQEAGTLYPLETINEFCGLQDQFSSCVVAADGLDLRRIRVPSPAFPLLRISLGAWFEATLAHEKRHLKQAQRVLHLLEEGAHVRIGSRHDGGFFDRHRSSHFSTPMVTFRRARFSHPYFCLCLRFASTVRRATPFPTRIRLWLMRLGGSLRVVGTGSCMEAGPLG